MGTKGLIHIYTGDGKGKTTAALGQVFRASGSGLKSFIIQFLKGQHSGELISAEKTDGAITIEQYGLQEFYRPGFSDYITHRGHAKRGFDRALEILHSGTCDIVVLDEIFGALENGLVSYEELQSLIDNRPDTVELILTGRNAPSDLFEKCDIVTEMKEIKHPFKKGTNAREGIDL